MNPRFLAAALWVCAAVMLVIGARAVTDARKRHAPRAAVDAVLAAAVLIAVFVNAGVDLW